MSTSLYMMATKQIPNPSQDPNVPTITVPQYQETIGGPYVAFYFNGSASVLISCEENATLDAAPDVLAIDPTALDDDASSEDAVTIAGFAGAQVQVTNGLGQSKQSSGGQVQAPPQSYRDALQQLNSGSPIILAAVASAVTI
jgi:hypothetical protein